MISTGKDDSKSVALVARPERLRLDPAGTDVIVIDMQNTYTSKRGNIDLSPLEDMADTSPSSLRSAKP